jgi:potassium/chloride transporter 9
MLNIVGAILFLRLSFAVGEGGMLGVLGLMTMGEVQCITTVLSLAALMSNGKVRGGGAYLLISRSLGPEAGGAIGALFYSAYSVGAAFYLISCAEAASESGLREAIGWSRRSTEILLASCLNVIVLAISLGGARCFTKVNVPLFAVQFGSIALAVGTIYASYNAPRDLEHGGVFEGFEPEKHLKNNLWPRYVQLDGLDHMSTRSLFALIFPAVTGIMEGANLSGDLARPERSVWKGPMAAIGGSYLTYLAAIFAFACSFDRDTLLHNRYVMQDTAIVPWIIVVGVLISTSSSALGAVFGGSRLLQALARDKVFPILSVFGQGSRKGDEPQLAVLATVAIAQCVVFAGGLDAVAPIISAFFCISYAALNFACFALSVSGTPNFRPRFRFFSWHTAAFGFIINMAVMFWIAPYFASGAVLACSALIVYLSFAAPVTTEWGDVRAALVYHQVRKYLLRMPSRITHGKLWRLSLLTLTNSPGNLEIVANQLKKGGVLIIGSVVVRPEGTKVSTKDAGELEQRRLAWQDRITAQRLKAFPVLTLATSRRSGATALMTGAGLGALAPNTILLDFESFVESREELEGVMADALVLAKNVVLAAHLPPHPLLSAGGGKSVVDVWLPPSTPLTSWADFASSPGLLLLQMAWQFAQQGELRVWLPIGVDVSEAEEERAREALVEFVKRKARVVAGRKGSNICTAKVASVADGVSSLSPPSVVGLLLLPLGSRADVDAGVSASGGIPTLFVGLGEETGHLFAEDV